MKTKRQAKIRELVRDNNIETQNVLTQMLAQAGFDAAQATISRDIHEMKLTRVPAREGGYKYALPPQEDEAGMARLTRVFKDGFVSMDCAGSLLVIRTFNGMAMAVAAALDAMRLPEVVGSIAGDDVVMCATKSESKAAELMERLKRIII